MPSPEVSADPRRRLPIRAGHTMHLDETLLERSSCLSISSGLVRVGITQAEQNATVSSTITLGFLKSGDHLPLDLLRSSRLHVQALTPALLISGCSPIPPIGASSLHEWTASLLMIRHLGEAEQRLRALLKLLTLRLGRRSRDGYELPLRLTHAELGELSGQNRVTVTRQLSRWRDLGLIERVCLTEGDERLAVLRLAPELIEAS